MSLSSNGEIAVSCLDEMSTHKRKVFPSSNRIVDYLIELSIIQSNYRLFNRIVDHPIELSIIRSNYHREIFSLIRCHSTKLSFTMENRTKYSTFIFETFRQSMMSKLMLKNESISTGVYAHKIAWRRQGSTCLPQIGRELWGDNATTNRDERWTIMMIHNVILKGEEVFTGWNCFQLVCRQCHWCDVITVSDAMCFFHLILEWWLS